ncbi:MAG TPA: DUF4129 domain-containing protein [Thermomicrobiales bacterium]|nr:DUF4129 domain-containing protein [Thermomicrobiales bacterium]
MRSARRRPRFDWWTEALVLALATAEAAVVWLLADLVFVSADGTTGTIAPLVVFLLIWLGAGLPRWLELLDFWEPWYQIALATAMLISTVTAIKFSSFPGVSWFNVEWLRDAARAVIVRPNEAAAPVWGVIALSAYAWWRGRRHEEPGIEAAYLLLRAGALIALVVLIGRASLLDNGADLGSTAGVLTFFAAALSAIALARIRQERRRGTVVISASWLPAFLGPVAVISLLALVVVGIFSRDALETILWLLAPVLWALSVILRALVLVLAVLAFIIVSPILWLLAGHSFHLASIRINSGPFGLGSMVERGAKHAAAIPDPIRYVIAVVVLTALFSATTRLILHRLRRPAPASREERDRLSHPAGLFGQASSRLWQLLRGARRRADPLDALRGDPRWADTVVVRETYRQFLRWSRDQRRPRDPSATPLEHAAMLSSHLTNETGTGDLAELTARYLEARYSSHPATPSDAAAARTAWKRLQRGS